MLQYWGDKYLFLSSHPNTKALIFFMEGLQNKNYTCLGGLYQSKTWYAEESQLDAWVFSETKKL